MNHKTLIHKLLQIIKDHVHSEQMSRQLDGVYRFDHAITATQKTILKAFGLTDANVKYRAGEICKRLETGN